MDVMETETPREAGRAGAVALAVSVSFLGRASKQVGRSIMSHEHLRRNDA